MQQVDHQTGSDFEIQSSLYYITLALLALSVITASFSDFGKGDNLAGWMDIFVLGVVILALVLHSLFKVSRNVSLGIVIYASIANFMAMNIATFLYSHELTTNNALYSLIALMVFMGVSGFIIHRASSLVVGAIGTVYTVFLTFSRMDPYLLEYLPIFLFLVIGFSLILFYYRGQLEQILSRLHSSNVQLEQQKHAMQELKESAETALKELQRTQARVVAQEKLASLGSLTAGIAHEIKNPLNFITNFAESSVELMEELQDHLSKISSYLSAADREDVDYLLTELNQNMKDISQHGQRGDRIVKSMLMHSRGASGVFSSENINALVEECMNLAFHGMRAQDTNFQAAKELELAQELPTVDIVRSDFARVILNLCNNAFYSVHKKRLSGNASAGYHPTVRLTTAVHEKMLEVRIIDNGTGLGPETRQKLFTPFFTTKPTGEGTGLGLSLSHDIIVQEHAGHIDVGGEEGNGATFIVRIPLVHVE